MLSTKLLCDETLRRRLAPRLGCALPQVRWQAPSRKAKSVVHVLPQLSTGGAETTLPEIIKDASHAMGGNRSPCRWIS